MREKTVAHARTRRLPTSLPVPPVDNSGRSLRILFLVSAHNGLSQRSSIALSELGHEVEIAVVDSGTAMEAAVRDHDPELIVCPFLEAISNRGAGTLPRMLLRPR
jgi:putative two-component system hydrogenase maturation factor HypX/HoxX